MLVFYLQIHARADCTMHEREIFNFKFSSSLYSQRVHIFEPTALQEAIFNKAAATLAIFSSRFLWLARSRASHYHIESSGVICLSHLD